jgi:hypothetical protein
MLPIVERWLRMRGCQVVVREALRSFNCLCDVVGARFGAREGKAIPPATLIAVELKLTRIAEVIRQAAANRYAADESYVAMLWEACRRMRPATLDKFRAAGVGLLSVEGERIVTEIPAERLRLTEEFSDAMRRKYEKGLWRRLRTNRDDQCRESPGSR